MSVSGKRFLVGRNCVVLGSAGGSFNSGDTSITFDTASPLLGVFDSVSLQINYNDADIHAANDSWANWHSTVGDFECRVTEIIKSDGSSILFSQAAQYDYFQVTWQAQTNLGATGGVAGPTISVIGKNSGVSTEVNEGKSVAVLTLHACGIGPTITSPS